MEYNEPPTTPPNRTILPEIPSRKAQSWGVIISIIIIVLMIITGAFYSWSNRITQENTFNVPTTVQIK